MKRDRRVALALAAAVLAQGVLLVVMARLPLRTAMQVVAVASALAILVWQAWLVRLRLNHRVDMLIVMTALGGFGMLLGWWVDLAGPALEAMRSPVVQRMVRHSVWGAVFSWMTFGMFVGAIPPSLWLTRCAELARASRRRWVSTHIVGNLAMLSGMIACGRLLGPAIAVLTGSRVVGMHVGMLLGMAVGMEAGMFLGEAALGLAPWREWTWGEGS